jgi:Ca2+/Na+ antiporter
MLILHIIAALSSIVLTSVLFFAPSQKKLHASYALVTLTLASGFYLVWTLHTRILEACTMGLLYLGFATFGIVAARGKLARKDVA